MELYRDHFQNHKRYNIYGVGKEIEFCLRHDIPVFYEVIPAEERYER
jgi:hypothetical protein